MDSMEDTQFIETVYRTFLKRSADETGRNHYLAQLRQGVPRLDLVLSVVSSNEYANLLINQVFNGLGLPNLTSVRPEKFRPARLLGQSKFLPGFVASCPEDFDWLESMILSHGYYEQPGVWSFVIDEDKRIIAEIIGQFKPRKCLELGCSAGAVLSLLQKQGIDVHGVEISHLALALAYADIRDKILFGDLTRVTLPSEFDVVFAMDVLEHINPNRMHQFVARICQSIKAGGFLVINVPAFGCDPVFGEVFPLYLEDWTAGTPTEPFSTIHVDDNGWPVNGHLIWATAPWWAEIFECHGLRRAVGIEEELHSIYDPYMLEHSRARLSYFVFAKGVPAKQEKALRAQMRDNGSLLVRASIARRRSSEATVK